MTTPAIDWDRLTDEATDILCRLIAIDTTNPPGNEEPAARFLADIVRSDAIDDITFYDASTDGSRGRVSMRARLRGDGSKRPLVLLNHTDVVPVERDGWREDPFAGLVRDGIIWGRGALDMKGMGVMELMTFLLAKRLSLPLKRDLVFLAVADEETGSEYGVEFLDREHPEALDAEFVLNEGGWGSTEMLGVRRAHFNCSVSEKGPCWVHLIAEGRPGHGSVPHDDNALTRLIRALNRVLDWQRPGAIVPELGEYFARAHEAGFMPEEPTNDVIMRMGEDNPLIRAITSNTISPTLARAGVKDNVIPAEAMAGLDCRLLPGEDADAFVEELRRVIDDPKVRIDKVLVSGTPPSPIDTELFAVIESVARDHIEEAVVLPSISAGFTDSRVFRKRGSTAYGFIPIVLEPRDAITIHGHNERLSIENLRLGCQIMFEVVRRICC